MIKEIKEILYAFLDVLFMAAFGAVLFYMALGYLALIILMGGHISI